jgi:hypothetical protein
LLYFNFYSGYSPDELLRRGGLHPAMYLHCFISIFIRVIRPTSFSAAADSTPQCIFIALFQFYVDSLIEDCKGKRFFLIYQINRVKAAAFG